MSTAATTASPSPASSSKRPAAASTSTPAAKRARSSAPSEAPDNHHDEEDEELKEVDTENMTEEELAKKARREARVSPSIQASAEDQTRSHLQTIRNRESAQRSRNQRKAHLAWLEARVVELEAENRALRSGSAPSTPSKTRESSPANSVLSLASDLGIPPEIVSAGGGVSLATVAPPSADVLVDIKPVVEAPATPTPAQPPQAQIMTPMPPSNPADMHVENAALRWRVSMLENIVKQAANFFSSYPTGTAGPMPAGMFPHPPFASPHQQQPTPGMELTLSPPLYPSDVREVASPLHLQTQLDTHHLNHNQSSASAEVGSFYVDLSTPLARHPAAVATLPAVSSERRGKALQRARGSLTGISLDSPANQRRLAVVARVIVELARLRGWTSASPRRRTSRATPARLKQAARCRTASSMRALRRRPSGTRR